MPVALISGSVARRACLARRQGHARPRGIPEFLVGGSLLIVACGPALVFLLFSVGGPSDGIAVLFTLFASLVNSLPAGIGAWLILRTPSSVPE